MSTEQPPAEISVRVPTAQDGIRIHRAVAQWGGLDQNSCYAYLMWCDRFAATSALAETGDRLAGFLLGFHPPGSGEVLFVWQVGVDPTLRQGGVGRRMLDGLIAGTRAHFVEAHVGAGNEGSERLFRGLTERWGGEVSEQVDYPAEWFPEAHAAERRFRIGPFEGVR